MATSTPTLIRAPNVPSNDVWVASWALGNADTGTAVSMAASSDRSVQVEGTFGAATITIQGSNDGTNYQTLTDPQGNSLTWTTANRLEAISELTRYIRPVSSGGTGTAVTVTILMKGARG